LLQKGIAEARRRLVIVLMSDKKIPGFGSAFAGDFRDGNRGRKALVRSNPGNQLVLFAMTRLGNCHGVSIS
jgi:hypothetical protein